MRDVYAVSDQQMGEWKEICEAYAKKHNANLLFVNHTSCGIETANGLFRHIYIDEMYEEVVGEKLD